MDLVQSFCPQNFMWSQRSGELSPFHLLSQRLPYRAGVINIHENRLATIRAVFITKKGCKLHAEETITFRVGRDKLIVAAFVDAHKILAYIVAMTQKPC